MRIYDNGRLVIDTGIVLTEPPPVTANIVLSDYNGFNVSCVDCFNGTINTNVTGGTAPYVFEWKDDPNITGPNRSNLNGGIYTLTINDANGCQPKRETIIALTMPNPKDWSRQGNANIDPAEFIGSTDASDVVFKSNNQVALRLMGNASISLPSYSGAQLLSVDANGELQKVDDIKEEVTKPRPGDCYNFSPAPGFVPTPTWTALPGKIYTCPNVGIGTMNPQQALDVVGITRSNLIWATPDINYSSSYQFYVDGASFLKGNTIIDGRVAIGAANGANEYFHPNLDYKLCVNGKIVATEVLVKNRIDWPDYVFKKDYKLKSIKEVNNFIKKYGHLPDAPTAKDVEANGINTGEMLNLQMQKIEELTLYIIDLQKQIDQLKQAKN